MWLQMTSALFHELSQINCISNYCVQWSKYPPISYLKVLKEFKSPVMVIDTESI